MSGGWQLRPGREEDLAPAVALINLIQTRAYGYSDIDVAMVREFIAADPDFVYARDQRIIEGADGEIIAVATMNPRAANMAVHPDHDAPELREALLAWIEDQGRARGIAPLRVGAAPAIPASVAVLEAAGYTLERFYGRMVRPLAEAIPAPALAAGYRLAPLDAEADLHALHDLDDRAFRTRPDYQPEDVAEFRGRHFGSRFAPGWSRVVETDAGAIVAFLVGWTLPGRPHGLAALLAVDPDHHRRGLGRALLLASFAAMRDAGLTHAELDVASDNPGAIRLYEQVGMRMRDRDDHYVRSP